MADCFIPNTLTEALEYRLNNPCIIMAGSSDLMVAHNAGTGATPVFDKDVLLIRNLSEIHGIKKEKNGDITIGACTTSREISTSALVPWVLRQASGNMGAIGLRNSATIGGNIANASPKGDAPGPLYLLNAVVNVESLNNGKRSIPINEFIIKFRTIDLHDDEIITSITIPTKDSDMTYWFYHKIGTRYANAISKLTLCSCVKFEKGIVKDFRIAATACGATTNRSRDAEKTAIGLGKDEFLQKKSDIASAFDAIISPRAMPEFRRTASKNMIEDFITKSASGYWKKFIS